ncbi:MAG: glycosyltransferase family 4 protein [Candidatus Woesearchaeota archaeon]|jgi:glycogen(starch) synthase|nr:glycosyltransferase family 4 protein [Candidatus Woesearchaeota archaeon]
MKVLMLGWEFPPYFAGGLGIACYELTKSLSKIDNIDITYIMPYGPKEKQHSSKLKIRSANQPIKNIDFDLKIKNVDTLLYAYDSFSTYRSRFQNILRNESEFCEDKNLKDLYGPNILKEVYLYAKRVAALCMNDDFDVIHAHDWTSIPAALLLKELTGKPVILHVHITEFDKTGGAGANPEIFKIEKEGFERADVLLAVSNFVKDRLNNNYGINSEKIRVVHNGGVSDLRPTLERQNVVKKEDKIVLFAGRITTQKGPEFFVRAARKVLDYEPNTKFIMAGSGDMLPKMIELGAELDIGKNLLFFGVYTRKEADILFGTADCFVMPSVSEPFGLVPLEAVAKGTPTIISKQSGISEVLDHSFKVDFWDTEEMANKIISLLRYEPLHSHIREEAHRNFDKFSWDLPAQKIYNIYHEISRR